MTITQTTKLAALIALLPSAFATGCNAHPTKDVEYQTGGGIDVDGDGESGDAGDDASGDDEGDGSGEGDGADDGSDDDGPNHGEGVRDSDVFFLGKSAAWGRSREDRAASLEAA